MGYKNFDDGLKKRLKEAGLEVNSDLDPEMWETFVDGLHTPAGENGEIPLSQEDLPPLEIFKSTYHCQPNYSPTFKLSNSQLKAEATKLRKTLDSRNQKIQSQMIKNYSRDLPSYLEGYLFPKCMALKQGTLKAELNKDLAKVCSQSQQIRHEVIMLYREEGAPGYQQKAENLIRKIWVSEPVTRQNTFMEDMPALKTSKNPLAQEIQDLNTQILNQCVSHQQAMLTAARAVGLDYISNINRSKTVVEGAIGEIYTPQRKKQIDQMYDVIKADVQALVPQLTSDKQKQAKIIDGYEQVNLFWMDKPSAESYTKNAQGIEILTSKPGDERSETSPNAIFSDPSLGFFSNANAYYTPQSTYGEKNNPSHIQIYPGYLKLLETNPYGLISILAHEIGPELSKLNGHDMREEEYKKNKRSF